MSEAQVIDQLCAVCHKTATDHGFWMASENTPEKVMLIITELAEYVEMYRSSGGVHIDPHCPSFSNEEIELADACIRIFDLAKYHNYQLGNAIIAKMKYNESRPRLHGKKF